jgi:FlaA1/EpsC-like NDP-sugar epimerase
MECSDHVTRDLPRTAPPVFDHSDEDGSTGPQPWWIRHRTLVAVAVYALVFLASLLGAFALAYNFHRSVKWFGALFLPLAVLAIPIKLIVFGWKKQFRGSWRYVGLHDLISVAHATNVSSFLFIAIYFVIENVWTRIFGHQLIDNDLDNQFRQSVFLIDWAGTIAFVSLCRVLVRLYYEDVNAETYEKQVRVLIVGAGDTGETLLREILRTSRERYEVVGFLDQNPTQLNRTIHGIEVLGAFGDIKQVCDKHRVEELLIALPKATPREIRRVVEICEGENLRFRIVPGLADLIDGRLQVSQMRDVDIEDLLGRDPVRLDQAAIASQLSDKRIVVTGAGGSIGSEMCRQIARFRPKRLILIEQAENSLFEIDRELRRSFEDLRVIPYVADICDRKRLQVIFDREQPTVLFHAAAHKHVPMMEINPGEAIKNNILGTRTVADAAVESGIAKMVMVSTDKAVNPTNIMGCTKRVAELYVQQLSARCQTLFVTVRFGNVLGSSGSVVPIFRRQIARGGPVTVTHPDMMRYFMTIPEASQLVLEAGAMGTGGEIYVLDMGDPVKIVDLARDMITLSGLRPEIDIDIQFTGPRPGEKLMEELSIQGEDFAPTNHPKIGIWKHRPEDFDHICRSIERLVALADVDNPDAIRAQLRDVVPEYHDESYADEKPVSEHIESTPRIVAQPSPEPR